MEFHHKARLRDRKINPPAVLGLRRFLSFVTMSPASLNKASTLTDVAGVISLFLAYRNMFGRHDSLSLHLWDWDAIDRHTTDYGVDGTYHFSGFQSMAGAGEGGVGEKTPKDTQHEKMSR